MLEEGVDHLPVCANEVKLHSRLVHLSVTSPSAHMDTNARPIVADTRTGRDLVDAEASTSAVARTL